MKRLEQWIQKRDFAHSMVKMVRRHLDRWERRFLQCQQKVNDNWRIEKP